MRTLSLLYRFPGPRYWLTWLILGVMRAVICLPFRWQQNMGKYLGRVMYYLASEKRRIAHINLQLCFPELDESARDALHKVCFENLGRMVIETGLSWWASDARLRGLYSIEGLEYIEQARSQQKPILLLSAHMSCTDIGARLLARHVRFQALYKRAKNPLFETMMLQARSRWYEKLVDRKETRVLLRGLKQGIATWYAPDQNFGREDIVFVPFFGIPTASLTATARIAKIADAAVIPFFPYRLPDKRGYKLVLGKPLQNFPEEDPIKDARRINAVIEEAVRAAPDQYMWVHKRFRTRPAGEHSVY